MTVCILLLAIVMGIFFLSFVGTLLFILLAAILFVKIFPARTASQIEVPGVSQGHQRRNLAQAPPTPARETPGQFLSGCPAWGAEYLDASWMVAELKSILQDATDPPTGSRRLNGDTVFSSFVRRRSLEPLHPERPRSEEAPTSTAGSASLGTPNVFPDPMTIYREHGFPPRASIRIDGGRVEMPTVMMYGQKNTGPTKQVTYAPRAQSSEHNDGGAYLRSPR